MTTKCPSCKFNHICPPMFKAKQEAKPDLCDQFAEEKGVMSDRNWT